MKMLHCRKVSQTCQQASRHNQAEAKLAEDHVKREFETLHQFLRREEAARLQALRGEQDEKTRGAEQRRDEINQVIKSLEEKIQLAEEVIDAGGDGVKFLQDYKDTLNRY
ncbi:tripartite motif-containing protein 35-like [Salarias fasciatus]|uniref:tripartite motif-containing protein 35-like n=1 Tax=Salarias fasciatus TaxID=181472 RepID=UPI001176722D|nr:tripartite motif-containing protein 35-like [Salarias fasciatus]